MALKLPGLKDTFEVVLKQDSAIDMTDDEYAEYLKTCDKSLLKLVPGLEPTRFLMRRVLPMRLAQKLQSHIKYNPAKGKDSPVDIDFMAYLLEEVRCALCGVLNPPNCPPDSLIDFVTAPDGGAGDDLMAQLYEIGAVMDLFNARKAMTAKAEPDKKK